ncbi:hypothetical protein SNE40_022139 [Patella caerulea]|uniref:CCHC-type domain-containing protein n=1 Tax=Patella caerulea TaxID=87958 RepID=A0AAN8G5K2_PATCE
MDKDKDTKYRKNRHKFKDKTVRIPINCRGLSASELIDKIEDICGIDCVRACVPRFDKYEVTLMDSVDCELLIENGINIEQEIIRCCYVTNKIKLVSIMNLPYYIEDEAIIEKFEKWGVKIEGEIRERIDRLTGCADGTRVMNVTFPPGISSLPFSVGFTTLEGYEYFSLKHDDQNKVCFRCLSKDHLKAECPDYKCRKCEKVGHYARNCTTQACPVCYEYVCICSEPPTSNAENETENETNDDTLSNKEERTAIPTHPKKTEDTNTTAISSSSPPPSKNKDIAQPTESTENPIKTVVKKATNTSLISDSITIDAKSTKAAKDSKSEANDTNYGSRLPTRNDAWRIKSKQQHKNAPETNSKKITNAGKRTLSQSSPTDPNKKLKDLEDHRETFIDKNPYDMETN